MKTLHYSIIAVLIFIILVTLIVEFPIYSGPNALIVPSKPHIEFSNTLHGLPENSIGLVFNGTQTSRDSPFYLKQGQNLTLVASITSDPTNLPVSLDIDSHVGFTKTNGIDSKLSITKIKTPGKVMIYVSATKDATPNTYQILVKANNTLMTMFSNFDVKVYPSDENKITTVKNNDPFGIIALVIYHPPDICLGPCPPNTFYLKINSKSPAYLRGYDICDDDSCTNKDDLFVLLPISDILKPDFKMIPLPEDLHWKYGDAVHIQLEVSPIYDTKTILLLDHGNSTIVP